MVISSFSFFSSFLNRLKIPVSGLIFFIFYIKTKMFESCKNTAMSAAFQTMSVTLWMCVESVAAMYVILWQAKLVLHLTGKGCSHTQKKSWLYCKEPKRKAKRSSVAIPLEAYRWNYVSLGFESPLTFNEFSMMVFKQIVLCNFPHDRVCCYQCFIVLSS